MQQERNAQRNHKYRRPYLNIVTCGKGHRINFLWWHSSFYIACVWLVQWDSPFPCPSTVRKRHSWCGRRQTGFSNTLYALPVSILRPCPKHLTYLTVECHRSTHPHKCRCPGLAEWSWKTWGTEVRFGPNRSFIWIECQLKCDGLCVAGVPIRTDVHRQSGHVVDVFFVFLLSYTGTKIICTKKEGLTALCTLESPYYVADTSLHGRRDVLPSSGSSVFPVAQKRWQWSYL